ncbi:MAG: DRTGG domain-containing protein [Tidjanibacter sp.]|nr:DRTGG domain-containing protein [Tidjanibacter sp.]
MKVSELAAANNFEILNKGNNLATEITGGYTSDLLSDVMGNVEEGMVWITLQVHRNIVAVAALKEVAAIILIGGARLDEETLSQAEQQGVTVLTTDLPAFETSGLIYSLLQQK